MIKYETLVKYTLGLKKMKLNYKLYFLSLITALSTSSAEAFQVMNDDIRSLDFNEIISCHKNRRLLKIGKEEYAVL